ncbi:MAG TPA: HNH endonuclease [Methylosinus sp.]|jgi:5-methylcytosine-specific restriction endonuclease McrA|uniref:HNH endonuclease n=1 Tax=Methylosinus sp. TaxID=427 RepID=UPI002F954DE1
MGVAGRSIYSSKRWERARFLTKRRDGFKCAQCGSRERLEVHHLRPVRERPDLAFDLVNLKTLCRACHAAETDKELGRAPNQAQSAWKSAVAELARPQRKDR